MNSNVWVELYKPHDYMMIELRLEENLTVTPQARQTIAGRLSRGPAYTIWCKEGVLACAGVLPLHRGVGEAWTLSSPLIELYPKSTHKIVKDYLEGIILGLKLHRVQALVDARFKRSLRWMEALGFHEEGVLHNYGADKQDFVVFAWVKSLDGNYTGRKRAQRRAGIPGLPAPVEG